MTATHTGDEGRLTAEEFLQSEPDAFGDVEIEDGLIIRMMAQSDAHSRVVRRLAAALEDARDPAGPCLRVGSDVAVRFPDAEHRQADRRLNVRYPDISMRDCEPYDVNTVRDHILLLAEVVSKATADADVSIKPLIYARAGIPVYLIVHFDKSWESIDRIEEFRLDWSGTRYMPHKVHRIGLVLDMPVTLAVTFEALHQA
ncbi:Uma2 family endonuclease [Nocardia sp. SYP-A9097]|uniref:Uma2 family endonuclease n=1 Tax=Nocardia sp. SYP-A9097 TaxID=2663237 RepID=UPI00129AC901|nr:Uma2 family endonuclease [Nocardia sp. SYP-A9097]MRH91364.1 Uma2 family endonuclease [Nocardia sp. SYP-A9097]